MNARDFVFRPNRTSSSACRVWLGIGSVTFAAGLYFAPQRTWLNLLLDQLLPTRIGAGR